MLKGDINPGQLEKTIIKRNPLLLVTKPYLKIKTKTPDSSGSAIIPLRLIHTQKNFLDYVIRKIKLGEAIRIWALKARQVFWTTLTQAIFISLVSQQKGRNAFTLANDIDGVNYIFDMAKRYYSYLKQDFPYLAPSLKRSNAKELVFDDLDSAMYIGTAGDAKAGQKYTIHYSHWSEVQMDVFNYELFAGYMQAVPSAPGTIFIGEGVGSEINTFFHKEFMKAYKKQSDWDWFFIGWLDHPEYQKPLNSNQEEFLQNTLTEEEKALITVHKATYEQLWWRRHKIINDCCGRDMETTSGYYYPDLSITNSFDQFNMYYPVTPESAFITQGRSIFPISILEKMLVKAPTLLSLDSNSIFTEDMLKPGENYARGYLFEDMANIRFVYNPDGPWHIYELPKRNREYILGADPMGGDEIEKNTNQLDFNAISIRDRRTKKQVAFYRHQDADYEFAKQIKLGCQTYNSCMAAVERGSSGYGMAVLRKLSETWPYIYYSNIEDEITLKPTKKIGWLSNKKTRPQLIDFYNQSITEGTIDIKSIDVISEAKTFVRINGKPDHLPGCYSDSLFADMIACEVDSRMPQTFGEHQYQRVVMCH